jgi:hypothetical protein
LIHFFSKKKQDQHLSVALHKLELLMMLQLMLMLVNAGNAQNLVMQIAKQKVQKKYATLLDLNR